MAARGIKKLKTMESAKSLYALLIGINAYKGCPPLSGCINDVLAVSDYMAGLCAKQEPPVQWKPVYLLAPAGTDEEALIRQKGIGHYEAPTRQNIIDAFKIFDPADPVRGDYCLFFYSGHGSFTRAPEVFRDCEPSGRLQTLVCADSRGEGGRDLLDKELGYLIAKALEGKQPEDGRRTGVHFLAITDSCHSGTNTRGDEQHLSVRMTPAANRAITENDILGLSRDGNCFYEKFEPGQSRVRRYGGLKHARYVKLASAQDAEKAFEKTISIPRDTGKPSLEIRHGVFTYSLIHTLSQSGVRITYGELMRRIQMDVAGRVAGQIPLLDHTDAQDEDLLFFRNEFSTPKPEYEVGYHEQSGEWLMNAGAIQGIIPSSPAQKTLARLSGKNALAEVMEVRSGVSVLDPAAFTEHDRTDRRLTATIAQMALPVVSVGFGADLSGADPLSAGMRQAIRQAWAKRAPQHLAWAEDGQSCDLEINCAPNRDGSQAYILNRPGNRVPLFERHAHAATFLLDAEKVARYQIVLGMNNPNSGVARETFRVEIQVMEGVHFGPDNLDRLFRAGALPPENCRVYVDPVAVEARFVKVGERMQQPAMKVSISINGIPEQSYWVGALYCDAQYGIQSHLLPVQRLGKNGALSLNMEFRQKEGDQRKWDAIPVTVAPQWRAMGVGAITDYIQFFISTGDLPFNLRQYNQEKIKLDQTRDAGFASGEHLVRDDWFTIKIPVTIRLAENDRS